MAERAGDVLRWPGGRARVRPWPGDPDVANLWIGADRPVAASVVDDCLARLRADGWRAVVTNALGPAEALPFVDAGFRPREQLLLMRHDLVALARPAHRTRRGRRNDRARLLLVDRLAFDAHWRLDARGLADALTATPTARLRVVPGAHGEAVAYAITGRAGTSGYVQRLAVHPEVQRRGLAATLVADSLAWLARNGAAFAFVNTQLDNMGARRLYESCGFQLLPTRLVVLGRDL